MVRLISLSVGYSAKSVSETSYFLIELFTIAQKFSHNMNLISKITVNSSGKPLGRRVRSEMRKL